MEESPREVVESLSLGRKDLTGFDPEESNTDLK